jgi:hypothetical protein
MKFIYKYVRVIIIDLLGITLLLAAAAFGWLPGPGGIPLALGGLALLAINHMWAERLLKDFKRRGLEVRDSFSKKLKK